MKSAGAMLLFVAQLLSLSADQALRHTLRVQEAQRQQQQQQQLQGDGDPHSSSSVLGVALLVVAAELPPLLLSPLAGAAADSAHAAGRRSLLRVLVGADMASALGAAVLLQLAASASPSAATLASVIASAWMASCGAVQWPAFVLYHRRLAPEQGAAERSGLTEAVPALAMLIAPPLAALFGNSVILSVAWVVLSCALSSALLLWYPGLQTPETAAVESTTTPSSQSFSAMWQQAREGLAMVAREPALTALFVLTAVTYLASGIVQVTMVPLVLALGSPNDLALVLTLSGAGSIVGAGLLYKFGLPSRGVFSHPAWLLLLFSAAQGVLLVLCGLASQLATILFAAATYMLLLPSVRGARQALLEQMSPEGALGRLVSMQKGLLHACLPLAASGAGAAAVLLQPWLAGRPNSWITSFAAPEASVLFVVAGLTCVVLPVTLAVRGTLLVPSKSKSS